VYNTSANDTDLSHVLRAAMREYVAANRQSELPLPLGLNQLKSESQTKIPDESRIHLRGLASVLAVHAIEQTPAAG
jgi:hypothetical protein